MVIGAGLALSASYSLRPTRLCERGALASLLLPAGYVAVPYLLGVFSVRASLTRADLILLAGLYVGFVGRIVLRTSATSEVMSCSANGPSSSAEDGGARAHSVLRSA